ncbi:MAG: PBP1A family penicillin-binding protein [Deltaproteobacteria bacterium]|nr:PBP1A family penicillin-binding protein [Deltaproteobacteria bacterium]
MKWSQLKNAKRYRLLYRLRLLGKTGIALICLIVLSLFLYYQHLNHTIVEKFEGKKWEVPSKIYSSSYLIAPGLNIINPLFDKRLLHRGYKRSYEKNLSRGQYFVSPDQKEVLIYLHDFISPSSIEEGKLFHISCKEGIVQKILQNETDQEVESIELEPILMALLYDKEAENRKLVKLEEVPPELLNAIISIEDERYFEHKGVDPHGILRAFITNIKRGKMAQGGSTLTQQLVKNFFLTSQKTFRRKVTEAIMAFMIESRYSKDEILETYVNEVYFGNFKSVAIHGVGQASLTYFSKDLNNLSLGEVAVLAGMIQAPNRYSPVTHPKLSLQRRNTVLQKMFELGKISKSQFVAALRETIHARPSFLDISRDAPYFVDLVRHEMLESYSAEKLIGEGYHVFTTLDLTLQRESQKLLQNHLDGLEKYYEHLQQNKEKKLQASLICLETHSGFIQTLIGGRAYAESQFNRIYQSKRQVGSLFKPFVFATALEENPTQWTLSTKLSDSPLTLHYDKQTWSPENYDKLYRGDIRIRDVLENSINVPTARLAWDIGINKIIKTTQALGIKTKLPQVPSLALGAVELSPLEITLAYATLANQGFRTDPVAIKTVIRADGKILQRRHGELQRALSTETSYLITSLLQGVISRGTAQYAHKIFDWPAAGKTGTTSDFMDAWFAGYTPQFVSTVWVGYDEETSVGLSGAAAALPLWAQFMKMAHNGLIIRDFQRPSTIVTATIDPETGYLATPQCPKSFEEYYRRGTEPSESCPIHSGGN